MTQKSFLRMVAESLAGFGPNLVRSAGIWCRLRCRYGTKLGPLKNSRNSQSFSLNTIVYNQIKLRLIAIAIMKIRCKSLNKRHLVTAKVIKLLKKVLNCATRSDAGIGLCSTT